MAKLLGLGVRFHTAPIGVRERLSVLPQQLNDFLQTLASLPGLDEVAVLSTCNRTEIYATVDELVTGTETLRGFIRDSRGIDLGQHGFLLTHGEVAHHLFRVASGLDSAIVGEGQILGQVRATLQAAQKAGTSGTRLDRLFRHALSVGKRVRTDTGIDRRDASVASAAVSDALKRKPDCLKQPIVIVGGGSVAELAASTLATRLAGRHASVTLVNRNEDRAHALSEKYGFDGAGWDGLPAALNRAAIVFVATGAPHAVIGLDDVADMPPDAIVYDLAVPRNVDSAVGNRLMLVNADALVEHLETDFDMSRLVTEAEAIVAEEVHQYERWRLGVPYQAALARLRAQAEAIHHETLAGLHPDLEEPSRQLVHETSRRLLNRLLHPPTARLRELDDPAALERALGTLEALFSPAAG